MASSITEKYLGSNNIYTDNYLKQTILLTKSIVLTSEDEAKLYNQYLIDKRGMSIDSYDKASWRYYLHLSGRYHPADSPITLTSLDNGTEITLTVESVELHKFTREELLKFDYYYKELVDRYPEQELLIKTLINTTSRKTVDQILELGDFAIVSYNKWLVEDAETNLIPSLQTRIDSYKVIRLITHYAELESYYLASLFHILYNYLFTSLIAIRLENAKTPQAHSYHILNYFASHHGLDKYYNYLTKKQILFLYRNLQYLNNHSGRNHVFKTLIEKLFTEKKISVVNYQYNQYNETDQQDHIRYRYNQKLLNEEPLVYDQNDFELTDLRDREQTIVENNLREYKYEQDAIDFKNKNSLFGSVPTKDIEITLTDNSNDVKHKLIPMVIDYWAYLLSIKQINFIATVVDPITNIDYNLRTDDMFRLFSVVLHLYNDVDIDHFPAFFCPRVYKPQLPDKQTLYDAFYQPSYSLKKLCEKVHFNVPTYTYCSTSYSYNLLVTDLYNFNLALWLVNSSVADRHINAQLDMFVENLHHSASYEVGKESVSSFLTKIAFTQLKNYSKDTLYQILNNILNAVTYNKLGDLGKNQYTQEALVNVFKQFTSYSIQVIDRYISTESILTNLKAPLYGVAEDRHVRLFVVQEDPYVDVFIHKKDTVSVRTLTDCQHSSSYRDYISVSLPGGFVQTANLIDEIVVDTSAVGVLDCSVTVTRTEPVDQNTLLFLSTHL